jgi:uncharacterized protein YndB with AHSA1/START domain
MADKPKLTITATVNAPISKVWEYYNTPEHVTNWNNASDDWHSPTATNDLKVGGRFNYRMESVDGAHGFDFTGVYTTVEENKQLSYDMDDARHVDVMFASEGDATKVTVTFEAEAENSLEMQQQGWQAILDNFKKYTETHT